MSKIEKDIQRIKEVLQRKKSKSTIDFGLIAFFTSRNYLKGNAKIKLHKKINSMFQDIEMQYNDINFKLFYRGNKIIKDDTDSWFSVVILMTNP